MRRAASTGRRSRPSSLPRLPACTASRSALVRNRDAAEELVQETFVRAFEKRAGFRGESSAATWLHRILHNLALDRARRAGREIAVEEVEERWRDDSYSVDAATVVERAQTRQELEDSLVRLPFIYRGAVLLHDVEGWTVAEIAERLGIDLPAATQRLRRADSHLRLALLGDPIANRERGAHGASSSGRSSGAA